MHTAHRVIAILCACSATAGAQAPGEDVPPRASDSWIDRPLVLRPGEIQLWTALDASNVGSDASGDSHTGEALVGSLAIGVQHDAQLAVTLTELIDPTDQGTFGSLTATGVVGLSEQAAIRFDGEILSRNGHGATALGVGFPIKINISPNVAFVSGSTGPSGFGHPFTYNPSFDDTSFAEGATPALFGESILAVVARDQQPNLFVFTLPAGLLVAPSDRIALRVHAAYQLQWRGTDVLSMEGPASDSFLLGGVDLLLRLSRSIDLGGSFDKVLAASTSNWNYEYGQLDGAAQVGVWMQARLGS
jgi:hypothetical protein